MSACPSCGTENPSGAKFCSECGMGLAEPVPAREGRKIVTVLFCDVTGSTELGEHLDPESLRGAMERYFERMQAVLESHGGTVEKFIGDAIMAVFGVPRVHEDDAVRAVRAVAEMRDALETLNRDLEAELGIRIVVRTGVNTGEVVAGERAADQRLVTGDAVNTAARLEQAAGPGEILIGEGTYELVRDAVDAEPVDPLALKGKAEAVGAYRLLSVKKGVAGHERRLDAPMIGRERQLRTLIDAFEGVMADRTCHLFTLLGPAGIGKSRLVREFGTRIDDRALLLTGRCLSYGKGITFWPVAEIVIQAAGIQEGDPPEEARVAIRTLLGDAPDADAIATQIADLLGMGGGGPVEASWAIRRFLEGLALQQPIVAVLDDIHWAEPTLLDVIEHVADWSRDAPILLLCMARPELLEERPGWGGGKRNATSVHLEPLSEPEADELIENLLGHPALTPEIRERIRAAAQGNPLFVEEMLEMLLDDGVLVLKEDEWVAAVDLTTVQVPPAISALLAARLDRLTSDERLVLEAASVVGEVFEPDAVRALVADPLRPHVVELLGALLRKDLIRPSASDVGGGEALRFRHILLRDAAYDAVPKTDRASLHEAFADHLGGALGERAAEFDEFIGYHLERSLRLRTELGHRDERTQELGKRAFDHLAGAGHRAFQRADMAAATNLLSRAFDLLPEDDPERIRMGWELGQAMIDSGAIATATDVLRATLDQARAAGDEAAAGYAQAALWVARVFADPEVDVDEWESSADDLVSLFERIGDRRGAALAWMQKSYALWFRERLEASGAAAERAIEHALAAADRYVESEMRGHLLVTTGLGPSPLEASAELLTSTLADARARGDRRLEQVAVRGMGMRAAFAERFDEARTFVAQARTITQELGLSLEYWSGAQLVGRIEWLAGDLDAAARELREGCEQLDALGETAFLSTTAGMLAEVEMLRGDPSAAEHWIQVAERTASPGDRSSQTSIELVRGQLMAAVNDPGAEHHLRRALELVDETDSPIWQSDVRLGVARALARSRREEAIELAREALELAQRKGVLVLVERARALLKELGASS
ncbi:MAG TPA: adenylate/guanylate cyclase domain-containing protein [Actinomycetota bacterium]|nr:adenylate/guanylate cyclase domain-containing protein [Actinomycetota bacterium]